MAAKYEKINIEHYGEFAAVPMARPDIKNCQKCWFGGQNVSHCPEGVKCVEGNKAVVFVRIEK